MADWLEAQGFARGYAWMKFARPCNEPLDAATDLDIRVVGRESAAAFGRVVVEGFGFSAEMQPWLAALPGRKQWICVMALAKETPVAGAAAYVDGGYAWLGFASTLAAHRRQGAQNAILARRLREAAVRGARTAVVETGERVPDNPSHSYRNILRAGFKEMYSRQNFIAPA
ncbi:MAG: hypothetical protein WD823_09980 [Sulfuricaulis sp.]|uniref:hypothetical protein n=1 Tax=Sulfuricaulis sp. TaxID=2003553 RepID=UPI0034A1C88A